jgi:hypothetical protein
MHTRSDSYDRMKRNDNRDNRELLQNSDCIEESKQTSIARLLRDYNEPASAGTENTKPFVRQYNV